MFDRQNKDIVPTLEAICGNGANGLLQDFCIEMKERYQVVPKAEFSCCSMERGWNLKFKKSGKSLCTVYPKENGFTAMVVIGNKEKPMAESVLPETTTEMQALYHRTKEGNGMRWLMIELTEKNGLYQDTFSLIDIRSYK